MQKKFNVTGMGCAACSARVEKCVSKLDGVENVAVNLLTNSMVVDYDESKLTVEGICAAVDDAGYGASEAEEEAHRSSRGSGEGEGAETGSADSGFMVFSEEASLKRRFLISLVLLIPIFYIAMGDMLGFPLPAGFGAKESPVLFYCLLAVLTAPVVWVNRKYFTTGYFLLFKRSPNMDSLIAVGSTAAIVMLYFESAAMILTLVTLGKWLEARSKGKTGDAIRKLIDLTPRMASVIRDGEELKVPADAVRVGETVAVRPGESVPVDGVIISGETSLDESALTGESVPAEKGPGDQVISASINKAGYFTFRATRVGSDTTLSRVIALVEEAGGSKAPISRLADKVAGVFVPIVMLISLASFIIWLAAGKPLGFAVSIAISVLVISCPCALGLATPVAIMTGTGRAAQYGILFKSAEALEQACKVDCVVLDKTGTITEGRPAVTDVLAPAAASSDAVPENSADDFLRLAASIEAPSEHPLGRAVVSAAEEKGLALLPCESFTAVAGRGARAVIGGTEYLAGNEKFISEHAGISPEYRDSLDALESQGKTPLIFASDGAIIGVIAVSDRPKPTSKEAIRDLKELGLDVIMLTGDNERTAEVIRRELDISEKIAGVLPQDKDAKIRKLQEHGRLVAMVGDGINDAPAITRADVGFAIGAATDIAIDSADVVLMKNDLADVKNAISLSRKVIKNIKMGLFWALFYNVICIPLAAGVYYPLTGWTLDPMIGAAAMSMSSVCVVTNALRLRNARP